MVHTFAASRSSTRRSGHVEPLLSEAAGHPHRGRLWLLVEPSQACHITCKGKTGPLYPKEPTAWLPIEEHHTLPVYSWSDGFNGRGVPGQRQGVRLRRPETEWRQTWLRGCSKTSQGSGVGARPQAKRYRLRWPEPYPHPQRNLRNGRQILHCKKTSASNERLLLASDHFRRYNGCRSDCQPPGGLQGGHRFLAEQQLIG